MRFASVPSLVGMMAVLMGFEVLGAVHQVMVGQNGTKSFIPNQITAAEGDTVEFMFLAGNHTATQSTFPNPCSNEGFDSGFVPGNATNPTSYSILVNNASKPIWVYCAQGNGGHCKDGQVMAINAPANGNTFAAFLEKAQTGTLGSSGNATGTNSTGSSDSAASSGTTNATGNGSGTGTGNGTDGSAIPPSSSCEDTATITTTASEGGLSSAVDASATATASISEADISASAPASTLALASTSAQLLNDPATPSAAIANTNGDENDFAPTTDITTLTSTVNADVAGTGAVDAASAQSSSSTGSGDSGALSTAFAPFGGLIALLAVSAGTLL
ncbi:hypothetical protein IAT40_004798 [Kwoniella sp. CBS 6097]